MTDISAMTDAELQALYQRSKAAPSPLASMTDDDLRAAYDAAKKPRGALDKLLGTTGPRYQTWPERAVREVVGLPEKAVTAAASAPPGSREATEAMIPAALETALVASPLKPRSLPGMPVKGPPSAAELKAAAGRGYDEARALGVDIKAESVAASAGTLRQALESEGINAKLAPNTFSILGELLNPPAGAVATISNIETVRRTLGNAAKQFTNPTEQLAATRAIRHFDDYLAGLRESDVLAGDATRAASILSDARGNYAAAKRSERVGENIESAELGAAAANSGQNLGNATRQKFKSTLTSNKNIAGYSTDEIALIDRIVRGTVPGNAMRATGNLLGGGGGLGAAVTALIGGLATAPYGGIGAAAPIVGLLLKSGERASVRRQANILDEKIRSRSPLAESMAMPGGGAIDPAKRAAIVRALLLGSPQEQPYAP